MRPRRAGGPRRDGGQIAPLLAVTLLGLVILAGLVTDAGLLFAARRDLQGTADGAARAGAMAIDEGFLRDSSGQVRLDPDRARQRAADYLADRGFGGRAEIATSEQEVSVSIEEQRRTLVMGLAGLRRVEVRARSSARPRYGIWAPEG